MRNIKPLSLVIMVLLVLLCGCRAIGPKVVHRDRYDYNIALASSNKQELLLNLVRLRYDQVPMFLHVGAISASTKFTRTGSLTSRAFFPQTGPTSGEGTAFAQLDYSENPIFNYLPYDDKQYTTQLLRMTSLKEVALLLQSSWSIAQVFRLVLQQAGTAVNAPSAARSTSSYPPQFRSFLSMTQVLAKMQRNNAIQLSYHMTKDKVEELVLQLSPNYTLSPQDRRILHQAGISIHQNRIVFSNTPGPHKAYVSTRSVLGMMNYLSKGVLIPPEDARAHLLTITRYPNGQVFDWQLVLGNMMTIRYSDKPPTCATVAIPYRGHWYYIDDRDGNSKKTLILLSNVVGLIASIGQDDQGPPISLTRLS
ncbi:hypothetical protein [Legionella jordanis]|uniref:Uncharacterized protein n=1 Tax=Legionella jordanis TaxID=456 RepID=A0A0W0VAV5_9GAMM|nr:hypothetical protein [Legionella jordanis]KTD17259.1 hypothetical protein Ljor_1565 [Legionella jordanis]RMX03372.1 hypothetical protein EAW55_08135 [Legionella jordanis]RMX15850.1 hypothetical protein EAS68_11490 [Legionella jordanis]VEH12544.1 Uncharacterised protein [Legionella jordanis]HAT8713382.1 hypothetical protein [Legionella jordanis]